MKNVIKHTKFKKPTRIKCNECGDFRALSTYSEEEKAKEKSTCNACLLSPLTLKAPPMMQAKCLGHGCGRLYDAIFPFGICPECKESEEYQNMNAITTYSVVM